MKGITNTIKVEDFLKLKELVDATGEESVATESIQAEVVDFGAFRQKTQMKKARRAKAKVQAIDMIKVVRALVADYEDQMMAVAHQLDPKEWSEKYDGSAFEQIRDDMRRLYAFVNSLQVAVEIQGAATLTEACDMIRKSGDEELVMTLDYILGSDYLGFQAIRKILEAVVLNDETYFYNSQSLCETWSQLAAAGFNHCIEPIAALCYQEALAI